MTIQFVGIGFIGIEIAIAIGIESLLFPGIFILLGIFAWNFFRTLELFFPAVFSLQ